jgi:hypothetical protein
MNENTIWLRILGTFIHGTQIRKDPLRKASRDSAHKCARLVMLVRGVEGLRALRRVMTRRSAHFQEIQFWSHQQIVLHLKVAPPNAMAHKSKKV